MTSRIITPYNRETKAPPVIQCDCGWQMTIPDMDFNTCPECGRHYNGFGQLVRCRLSEIDYLDAGERWDDEY